MDVEELVKELKAVANPDDAVAMKAYMKNKFEFLGVKTPARRKLAKVFFKQQADSVIDWNFINEAWNNPYRELQYVALDYLEIRKKLLTPSDLPDLKNFNAILFNSANSVIGFMKKIKDMRILANVKIGVVGEKTAEEIEKYKIIPDFYPKEYTVEKLAYESTKFTSKNDKILFVVSNISPVNTKKYSNLYERKFEKVVVYNTNGVKHEEEIVENYVKKSDILMFLSSSTFKNFWQNLKNKNLLNKKIIASIGPVTTKTIQNYGCNVQIEAKRYTEDGLFEEILKYKK